MPDNSKNIIFEKIDDTFILNVLRNSYSDCGSYIIFEGKVRADEVDGEKVEKIIYESYIEMAEKELERIKSEAIEKFKVKEIIIKHRVGEVKVGEVALFVAVISGHRKEGFSAIQYIINEIKTKVPIWKKEILSNGKTRWVEESNYD